MQSLERGKSQLAYGEACRFDTNSLTYRYAEFFFGLASGGSDLQAGRSSVGAVRIAEPDDKIGRPRSISLILVLFSVFILCSSPILLKDLP